MAEPHASFNLTRTLITIALTSMLLLASLWVLSPFLLGITWATMITVASWPLMIRLERFFRGYRSLAILTLITGLLLMIFLPFTLAIFTLVDHAADIAALAASLKDFVAPTPPQWLTSLPWLGKRLGELWTQGAALGVQGLTAKAAPYAGSLSRWFADRIGGLGMLLVQILLAVSISAIFYYQGETAAATLRRFMRKLGGRRGEEMVLLAAGAIRGVALGVGVTALLQAVLGGLGLFMAGIPFATLLTALMFMLCIAQLGAVPVLLPAVIWLYWNDQTGWAVFLLVWMIVVVNLDNFLRPWLIQRGADLPLLLIFAGVIGGIISMGLVGIFLGPLLLALSYTLTNWWMSETDEPEPDALPPEGDAPIPEETPPA